MFCHEFVHSSLWNIFWTIRSNSPGSFKTIPPKSISENEQTYFFPNSKNTKSKVLESKDFGKVFLKIVTLESSKNKNENFLRPSKKRIQIFSSSYQCPKEPPKVSRLSEFNWLCTTKKFEKTQTQIVGYNIYTMCSKS